MPVLNSGETSIINLPPFGKYSLHLVEGSKEAMLDVTKVGGSFTIYGIIGDKIDVAYSATAGNELSITYNGTGVLKVDAYSQLASTVITL